MVKKIKKENINEKKEIEDILEKENIKKQSKSQNKQLMWIILLMTSVILIVILVPFIVNQVFNKFEYNGMKFQKTGEKNNVFYSTKIPLFDTSLKPSGTYSINFREDPRKSEDIKLDVPDDEIVFSRMNVVFISLDPNLPKCEDNLVAVASLTQFLKDFGNLEVRGALSDKISANESKLPYVTCNTLINNTVIMVNAGNETSIKRTAKNCYEIQYKDCEINKVMEKLELIILKKYISLI